MLNELILGVGESGRPHLLWKQEIGSSNLPTQTNGAGGKVGELRRSVKPDPSGISWFESSPAHQLHFLEGLV